MSSDAIAAWLQRNNTETARAAANDLFVTAAAANLNTSAAVDYARRMAPEALAYQRNSQSIVDASTARQTAAEGAMVRGMLQQQGDLDYRSRQLDSQTTLAATDRVVAGDRYIAEQGRLASENVARTSADADRFGYAAAADSQRYQADRGLDVAREAGRTGRYTADVEGGARRYEADAGTEQSRIGADASKFASSKQAESSMYGADREADATKFVASERAGADRFVADRGARAQEYGADRAFDATRDTNRSNRQSIRISGDQDRKTQGDATDQTLRLRADARGAIASRGAKFYA
jgi:hypothetical protein